MEERFQHSASFGLLEGLCFKPSKVLNGVTMAAILVREISKPVLIGMKGSRGII
jgi:hypothetical protein